MKRVAIIGADFAPSSLPPALRIRFFANHLPEFGWQPTIITTDPRYYECALDPDNERLLPPALEVIRTPAAPARITRKLGIGDIGMRSLWHHWRALSALCGRERIDLLFLPVPPYISMILGRLAYHRFGIPYVIDYIDPWVTDHYWKLPRSQRPPKWVFADALSRIAEPFAVRKVGGVVGVSQATIDMVLSRYSWLTDVKTAEIPYGGEAGDFEYLRNHPRSNPVFDPSDGYLHLTYVGACIPPMFGVLRALFDAVSRGLERSPELFSRLRMHFIGTSYAHASSPGTVAPIAREMGVGAIVTERPARVSYLDALQLQLDSHALMVIGSDHPHYTASKLFPYILAKRPLLAIVHESSTVVGILQKTRAGRIVAFNEKRPPSAHSEDISTVLEEMLRLSGTYQPPTRWDAFESFTTAAMAGTLAATFDRVVGKASKMERVEQSVSV
jgi:hypothetical protein